METTDSKIVAGMPCQNPTQVMNKPMVTRTSTSSVISRPTFTMYGEPLPPKLAIMEGLSEKVRKPNATKDTSNWATYFASDNYENRVLNIRTIVEGSVNTTLRYNQQTYYLLFVCIHQPLWNRAISKAAQISLLFRADNGDFYHICIPVAGTTPGKNESPILRSWLQGSPLSPAGLSWNDLLNFRGHEKAVNYSVLDFCLEYNYQAGATPNNSLKKTNSYTLSIFETPLYCIYGNLSDIDGNNKSTFDEVFNLFMRGTINKYLAKDKPDPYLTPDEIHFSDIITQNVVVPVFFTVPTIQLSGTIYTQDQLTNNARGLSNVKCYPIDLASQVDDNGNIYIDRETNKPIDTSAALGDLSSIRSAPQINAPSVSVSVGMSTERRNAIIYTCIALLIGTILILIAVWFFTRALPVNSIVPDVPVPPAPAVPPVPPAPANVGNAARAAANAAASAAPAPQSST
jgi:hypothetical protein